MNDFAGTLNTVPNVVGGFAAGKNKIINGDFRINQRAFTSTTTTSTFGFDRFTLITAGDGSTTYSAQTFTPGAAPVAGYEAINFARMVTTGQTSAAVRSSLNQPIEDVRTFAGQTVTVSFWAKANSGTPKVAVELRQDFGSGGSTAVNNYAGQVTLSTAWARYSVTVAVPSISGKTIGTSSTLFLLAYVSAGSDFNSRTGTLGIQTNTFEFWGVQVEAGSVATPFQTATGTLQGELAACQRYYFRISPTAAGENYGIGYIGAGLGDLNALLSFPVSMRIKPSALEQSGTAADYTILNSTGATTCTAVPTFAQATQTYSRITLTSAGTFTANSAAMIRAANANAYLGWSAEL
jgi:hypothetical protein